MYDKNERETLTEEFKRINREKFEKFYETICESFDDFLERKSLVKDDWKMKCPYKYGDNHYCVQSSGDVFSDSWHDIEADYSYFSQGNIFTTKQAAELEVKRRNLLTRFKAFRDECNGDWKVDCKDVTQKKYYVSYSEIKNSLYVSYIVLGNHLHTFGYFKNKEDAERAIELFGDEIKKLFIDCECD
jgi:hypothetical protein